MHTQGKWTVTTNESEVALIAGARFLAYFEVDEFDEEQDPDEPLANAERAAACVNACAEIEDPERQIPTLRADSGYLGKYRDAYCANVVRLGRMTEGFQALRTEVLATRAVLAVFPWASQVLRVHANAEDVNPSVLTDREKLLETARQAVDATSVLADDPTPNEVGVTEYRGLDVANVQQLLTAVHWLLDSVVDIDGSRAVVGRNEFVRLQEAYAACLAAPKV